MRNTLITFLLLIPAWPANSGELQCLAEAIYFEARNQGSIGMMAVGVVIQNRVKHHSYPSSICEVVQQGYYFNGNPIRHKCQFSYWCDGKHERPSEKGVWVDAMNIAEIMMSTKVGIIGLEKATHYHGAKVNPAWAKDFNRSTQIGAHIFYSKEDN
jgi:spore germination cell wall hydrolase CwlJ-like protein